MASRRLILAVCTLLLGIRPAYVQGQEERYDTQLAERYLGLLLGDPTNDFAFEKLYQLTTRTQQTNLLVTRLELEAKARPNDTPRRVILARLLQRTWRFRKALTQYGRVASASNRADFVQLQIGICHRELSEFPQARAAFERAASASQRNKLKRQAFKLLGQLYLHDGQPAAAIRSWRRIVELEPDDYYAYRDLASMLGKSGFQQEAITLHQQILARFQGATRRVKTYLALAQLNRQLGQFDEAAAAYDRLFDETGPSHWVRRQLYVLMRELHQQADQLDVLIARYRKLLQTNPWIKAYTLELAAILRLAGKGSEAIALLTAARKRLPQERDFLAALIDLLRETGQFEPLIKAYGDLLKLVPRELTIHLRLGQLYWDRGRQTEALALWESGRQTVAGRAQDQQLMARHYERLYARVLESGGDSRRLRDLALTAHRASARLSRSPLGQRALARFLHRLGRKEEALAAWRQMVSPRQQGAEKWGDLAREYLRHGYLERAESAVRSALTQDATHFGLHLLLGKILDARGRFEPTVAAYRLARRLAQTHHDRARIRAELVAVHRTRNALPALIATLRSQADQPETRLEALLTLAVVYSALAQTQQGITCLEGALRALPKNSTAGRRIQLLTRLAELYHRKSPPETDRTIEIYRQLSRLNHPLRWQYYLRISQLLDQANDPPRALSWLDRIHRGHPRNAEVLHKAGVALGRHKGHEARAIELLQRAIALKPNDVEYYWSLASVLRRQGKLEQERQIYRRILAVATDPGEVEVARERLHKLLHRLAGEAGRQREPERRLRLLCAARGHGTTPALAADTLGQLAQVGLELLLHASFGDHPISSERRTEWRRLVADALSQLLRRHPDELVHIGKNRWVRSWLLARDLLSQHHALLGSATAQLDPLTRGLAAYTTLLSRPRLHSQSPPEMAAPLHLVAQIPVGGTRNLRPLLLPAGRLLLVDGSGRHRIYDLQRRAQVLDDPLLKTLDGFRAPLHGADHQFAIRLGKDRGVLLLGRDLRAISFDGRPLWRLRGRDRWVRRTAGQPSPGQTVTSRWVLHRASISPWSRVRLRNELFYRATVRGDRVYALDGKGRLFALSAASGELLWVRQLDVSERDILPHFRRSGGPDLTADAGVVCVRWRGIHTVSADDGTLLWKLDPDKAAKEPAPYTQMVWMRGQLYLLDTRGRLSVHHARTGRYSGPGAAFARSGLSTSRFAYIDATPDLLALVGSSRELLLFSPTTHRLIGKFTLPIQLYAGYDRTPQRITLTGSGQHHTLFILADKLHAVTIRHVKGGLKISSSATEFIGKGTPRGAFRIHRELGCLLYGQQLRLYQPHGVVRRALRVRLEVAPNNLQVLSQLAQLAHSHGDTASEQTAHRDLLRRFRRHPARHAIHRAAYHRSRRTLLKMATTAGTPLTGLLSALDLAESPIERAELLSTISMQLESSGQVTRAVDLYRTLLAYPGTIPLAGQRRLSTSIWARQQLIRLGRSKAAPTKQRPQKRPTPPPLRLPSDPIISWQHQLSRIGEKGPPSLPLQIGNKLLALAGTPPKIRIVDLPSGRLLGVLTADPQVIAVNVRVGVNSHALASDGHRVAYAGHGITCHRIADGVQLWRHAPQTMFHPPAILGERLYAVDLTGLLHCLDLRTGQLIWRNSVAKGAASSTHVWDSRPNHHGERWPLIETAPGIVFCLFNQLAAFDWQTGRRLWSVAHKVPTGGTRRSNFLDHYAGAVRHRRTLYLLDRFRHLSAIDLDTGREKWMHTFEETAHQLLVRDGMAYLLVGDIGRQLLAWDLATRQTRQTLKLGNQPASLILGKEALFVLQGQTLRHITLPTLRVSWSTRLPLPEAIGVPKDPATSPDKKTLQPLASEGRLLLAYPDGTLALYRSLSAERTALQRLAQSHPGETLLARARLADQLGEHADAARYRELALAQLDAPGLARMTQTRLMDHYLDRARRHAARQLWKPALHAASKAGKYAQTTTQRRRAMFHSACLHAELGALDRAVPLFKKVIEAEPDLFCQLDSGRAERAWTALRFRLARSPRLAAAWRKVAGRGDPRTCPGTAAARSGWHRQSVSALRQGHIGRATWLALRALGEPADTPPSKALVTHAKKLLASPPTPDPDVASLQPATPFASNRLAGIVAQSGLIFLRDPEGRPMAFLQRDLSLVWATLDASPELVSAREGRRGRSLLEPRIIAHQLFCGGNALTCRDPATGALSWSYQLATRHDPLDHFSGDLVRKSMTQPLWAPARLGSFLYTVDRAERIHCIDPIDGRTAWILSVAQVTGRTEPKRYDPHATHWSIHGIADRHLLLQTDRLYLFSPGGHFRFRTPAQISQAAFGRKSGRFSPYLDMAWNDQTLYLLTHAGRLQSLELDRPVIRQVTLTTSGSWRAVAAGSTTVYLLGPTRLVACDARLTQLRWSRTLPLIKGVQSPLQQFGPGLLLGAQTVYVNREALFAFSRDDGQPTGKLIWPVYGTRVGLNGTYPVIAGQDVLVHIKQGKPVLYRGTR